MADRTRRAVDAAGATAYVANGFDGLLYEMRPLDMAAAFGKIDAVKVLLAAGADLEGKRKRNSPPRPIPPRGYTPLTAAAMANQQEMAEFLLSRGADIEAASAPGVTALSAAAARGNKEMCGLLLVHGAKLNGKPGVSRCLPPGEIPRPSNSCWNAGPKWMPRRRESPLLNIMAGFSRTRMSSMEGDKRSCWPP